MESYDGDGGRGEKEMAVAVEEPGGGHDCGGGREGGSEGVAV